MSLSPKDAAHELVKIAREGGGRFRLSRRDFRRLCKRRLLTTSFLEETASVLSVEGYAMLNLDSSIAVGSISHFKRWPIVRLKKSVPARNSVSQLPSGRGKGWVFSSDDDGSIERHVLSGDREWATTARNPLLRYGEEGDLVLFYKKRAGFVAVARLGSKPVRRDDAAYHFSPDHPIYVKLTDVSALPTPLGIDELDDVWVDLAATFPLPALRVQGVRRLSCEDAVRVADFLKQKFSNLKI